MDATVLILVLKINFEKIRRKYKEKVCNFQQKDKFEKTTKGDKQVKGFERKRWNLEVNLKK